MGTKSQDFLTLYSFSTLSRIEAYAGLVITIPKNTPTIVVIAKVGNIQKIKEIPKNIRKLFVTALDIKPEWHVRIQAAWQKYTDNSVSKTINLPANATKKDVKKAFELAYKLKCKGITVYRYGSKKNQVLSFGAFKKKKFILAEPEYSGGCVTRICPVP